MPAEASIEIVVGVDERDRPRLLLIDALIDDAPAAGIEVGAELDGNGTFESSQHVSLLTLETDDAGRAISRGGSFRATGPGADSPRES